MMAQPHSQAEIVIHVFFLTTLQLLLHQFGLPPWDV